MTTKKRNPMAATRAAGPDGLGLFSGQPVKPT